MKGKIFNNNNTHKRVLLAPLDWGLGHSTRCIPIIYELLNNGLEVFIATEGAPKKILEKEFPNLHFLPLRGYNVRYSAKSNFLYAKLLQQLPGVISCILYEKKWLKKVIKAHSIDAVISDNRFGLHNKQVPCIFITHQLKILTGNRFTQWIAQNINYHFINKFSECWVPDAIGDINLAGELSHPRYLPKVPVHYLGPLTRFKKIAAEKKYELCISLSGPEPQRTILEDLIFYQLQNFQGKIVFARGLPGEKELKKSSNPNVEVHNYLSSEMMNMVMLQSDIIISRSGYTTVMDLIKLQKRAILIATPEQPEQEYLSKYLMSKKIFYTIDQAAFSLTDALEKSKTFAFAAMDIVQDEYKKMIASFCKQLKN